MNTQLRSVWGRSLLAAVALHIALAAYLLSPGGLPRDFDGSQQAAFAEADLDDVDRHVSEMLESIVTTHVSETHSLVDEEPSSSDGPGDLPVTEGLPVETTVAEPGEAVVERAAQAILDQAGLAAEGDALGELLRKSRVLEQISNADEVARMSTAIRDAIGAERRVDGAADVDPAGPFEFETAFVVEAVREERGRSVTIQESLRDDAGRMLTVLTRRTLDAESGEASYAVALMRAGVEPEWMAITLEEWEEAVVRQEPYRVINQFPLVKLLHQEAVLPIMAKLSQEGSAALSPPSTTPTGR